MAEKGKDLLVRIPTQDDLVEEKVENVRNDGWALSKEVNREWSTYLLEGGSELAEMGQTGAMWAGGSALAVGGTTALVVGMTDPFFAVLPFLWHFVMPMLLMCGGGMAAFWWLAKFMHKHATERALKRVADREDERLQERSVYYREIADKMPARVKQRFAEMRDPLLTDLRVTEQKHREVSEALRQANDITFYKGENKFTESVKSGVVAERDLLAKESERIRTSIRELDERESEELAKIAISVPLIAVVASREHRDANNPEGTIAKTNAELDILSELDNQIDELMMLAHLDAGMPVDDAMALMDGQKKPELPASTEDKPVVISDDDED